MEEIECTFDENERIWSGPKRELFYDYNCSIGRILFNSLRNHPENVLQICDTDGRSVTNAELLLWATRIAQYLKQKDVQRDDIVGIVARNSTYLLAVAVSCLMSCTPLHAVRPIFDEDSMEQLFGMTKPKVIFCDADAYDSVFKATEALRPLIYTLTDHVDGVPHVEDLLLQSTKREEFYRPENLTKGGAQTMAILCSSGTTGTPKNVCISNYSMVYENLISNEDVFHAVTEFDWITGLISAVAAAVTGCTRIITNRPYTPEYFVQLVQTYKINYAIMSASHAVKLLSCPSATAENLCSLQALRWSGGAMSTATMERLSKLLPKALISCDYGLSEISSVAYNFGKEFAGSAGKLTPGKRARIVDDDGNNLAHNEIGEILIHDGREWKGYYQNSEATRHMQDLYGWFHTGDLGYFDNKNFLFIVDRMKDVMRYDSRDYFPSELERVVYELPEVTEVCVVGMYDETIGHKAGALVVLKPGCSLSEQKVVKHVRQRLPEYHKQLYAGVCFTDKLPRNDNGKLLRIEAKTIFDELRKLVY